MDTELAPKTQALIARLSELHPEIVWTTYPLCDYDQHAEVNAPETLVSFGHPDVDLDEGLVDPYSTIYGNLCEPATWGISEEAAQLIQAHNQVYMARYPNGDGPRQYVVSS